jgi:predicted nucleic acid-binding protein
LLAKREPFYIDAQNLFTFADRKEIELQISALTFANAFYTISKHHKSIDTRKFLLRFKVLVTVLSLDDKSIDLALASDFEDFEDGLQYIIALDNNSETIVTRNKKDFKNSKIPIMTAGEYLNK